MNKEVVVFLKEECLVDQMVEHGVLLKEECLVDRMVEHGVLLKGMFIQVTPLFSRTTRVTISNVPPFIPNELLEPRVIAVWEVRQFN